MKKMLSGFAVFIKEYNIAGMAVAFIMGLKVSELVTSLVEDILMPALLQPAMNKAGVDSIAHLATANGILYGKFLSTLIDFTIVAFVMYLLVTYLVQKFIPQNK